jgi:hypothetical protein
MKVCRTGADSNTRLQPQIDEAMKNVSERIEEMANPTASEAK